MKDVKSASGLLGNSSSLLKQISNVVFNAFGHLVDLGLRVDDMAKQDDGSFILQVKTNKNHILKMKIIPVGDKKFDVAFKRKDGKTIVRKKVPDEDVDDAVLDAIREIYGPEEMPEGDFITTNDEDVESTVKISVKKSISASDEIGIDVLSITQVSDPIKAYQDLGIIFSNGEFVDSIPKEETCYGIQDNGECLDVCPVEMTKDTYGCIRHLIQLAYTVRFQMQYISWTSGKMCDSNIRSAVDGLRWMIDDQIQQLGELSVELHGCVDNPKLILCFGADETSTDGGCCIDINSLTHCIDSYICALELYSCMFSQDVIEQFMQWIRHWKKELNYHMKDNLSSMTCNTPLLLDY